MKGAFWLMVLGALGSAAIAVRLGHAADARVAASAKVEQGAR